MVRQVAVCVVVLGLLAGAAVRADEPNATYTLKVREPRKGDKLEVAVTVKGVIEITEGKQSFKLPEDQTAEYLETVLELPEGATRPTKLTRAYKKATHMELMSMKPETLSYVGKTVAIEKKADKYEYSVDGKKLDGFDAVALAGEFERSEKAKETRPQDLLPKKAVKLNDPWAVDIAAVKGMLGGMPFGLDEKKSKATGVLTKVYAQDGKQRGTLVFDLDLVVNDTKGGPKGGSVSGTMKVGMTLDAVIDGSAPDTALKITLKADVTGSEPGKSGKMVADVTRTKTVKSVK